MDAAEFINQMEPVKLNGIEILEAEDGQVRSRLEKRPELCYDIPDGPQIISGVGTYALADASGAAAMISKYDEIQPAPTVDMRIDYLNIATTDLLAEAEVVRYGKTVSQVEVDITDEKEKPVASVTGVYISR